MEPSLRIRIKVILRKRDPGLPRSVIEPRRDDSGLRAPVDVECRNSEHSHREPHRLRRHPPPAGGGHRRAGERRSDRHRRQGAGGLVRPADEKAVICAAADRWLYFTVFTAAKACYNGTDNILKPFPREGPVS